MPEQRSERHGAVFAVCGHIALDIIPAFGANIGTEGLFVPGGLMEVGAAACTTGGAVSNTGIALHRLGAQVRLIGKVGEDSFGAMTVDLLRGVDPSLAGDIVQSGEGHSSYTIVLSIPGSDRIFLHSPGMNDRFDSSDIDLEKLRNVDYFHFGYPPLMKRLYDDGGVDLSNMLANVKALGVTTSLDMAMPGRGTEAYAADWEAILTRTLPHVDIFMPSVEEMLMMSDKIRYEQLAAACEGKDMCEELDVSVLQRLADELLGMGCGIVVLKLGAAGLYMRTSPSAGERLFPKGDPEAAACWNNRELRMPCYKVKVVGTTGAGDSTIAGFLKGVSEGLPPEAVLQGAVAVGACSVESVDATGGIIPWTEVQARLQAGWEPLIGQSLPDEWVWKEAAGVWSGPRDKHS